MKQDQYLIMGFISLLMVISIVMLFLVLLSKSPNLKTKALVINLPHNEDRLIQFKSLYQNADIKNLPLEVFPAVDGKKIEIKEYVTKEALEQILFTEKNGYRLRHRDLTRGGVGCYLSHVSIYKQLLQDPDHDYYIIFEDDAIFHPDVFKYIKFVMTRPPKDWDLILFGRIRCKCEKTSSIFEKAKFFWGLFGYAINKKGAQKVIENFEKTGIDMQIDSAMSKMSQNDQLNVYGLARDIVSQDSRYVSNIQKPLKKTEGIDPFQL